MAILYDTGKLASPQYLESLLHLGEDIFNGVVLRRVRDVEYESKAQPRSLRLRLLALVRREVIEEDRDLLLRVYLSQLLQVCLELGYVDGVVVDLEQLLALLLVIADRTASVGSFRCARSAGMF